MSPRRCACIACSSNIEWRFLSFFIGLHLKSESIGRVFSSFLLYTRPLSDQVNLPYSDSPGLLILHHWRLPALAVTTFCPSLRCTAESRADKPQWHHYWWS